MEFGIRFHLKQPLPSTSPNPIPFLFAPSLSPSLVSFPLTSAIICYMPVEELCHVNNDNTVMKSCNISLKNYRDMHIHWHCYTIFTPWWRSRCDCPSSPSSLLHWLCRGFFVLTVIVLTGLFRLRQTSTKRATGANVWRWKTLSKEMKLVSSEHYV